MSHLDIEIHTDNDAFADESGFDNSESAEVVRILQGIITRIEGGDIDGLTFPLKDINGNTVGEFNHFPSI